MMGRSAGENTVNETAGTEPTVFDPGDGSAMGGNVSGANPQVSPPVNVPPANADDSPCSDASTATLSSAADARQSATDSAGSSDASTTAPGNAAAEPEAWVSPARSGSGWGESSSSAGGHSGAESATWGHSTGGESRPQSPMHAVARPLASATGVSATFGIGQTNALAVSPDVGSSQANVGSAGVRAWRHWRWFVVLGIIGLTIAVPVFPLVWVVMMGKAELARAIAETDALDPNWRWEDIRAAYSQIPRDPNGWPLIEEIYRRFDQKFVIYLGRLINDHRSEIRVARGLSPIFFDIFPPRDEPLTEQWHGQLKLYLEADFGIWDLLRQLPRYEHISPPLVDTPTDRWWLEFEKFLTAANAVAFFHEYFLHERKSDLAEECLLILTHSPNTSERAIHNGHGPCTVGDNPWLVMFDWRNAFVARMRRHLALTEVSAETLEKCQRHTERLLAQNALTPLVRFHRAALHEIYSSVKAGKMDWFKQMPESNPLRWVSGPLDFSIWEVSKYHLRRGVKVFLDKVERSTAPLFADRHHAELLRQLNQLHRLANASPEDQLALFKSNSLPPCGTEQWWAGYFLPQPFRGDKLQDLLWWRAELQALRVAIAAERYRLKYGQWPDKLETLVPEFLAEVPGDPFNLPNPLRLVRTVDGLVVYSIGLNLRDDGGDLSVDVVVRLSDPSQRGLTGMTPP
jgi:hypothetical protein